VQIASSLIELAFNNEPTPVFVKPETFDFLCQQFQVDYQAM